MPKPLNQSCENCMFRIQVEGCYGSEESECHRLPIAYYADGVEMERPGTLSKTVMTKAWAGWPPTELDDWCGEWKGIDPETQPKT